MLKSLQKQRKQVMGYFGKHVEFNAFAHALGGIAIGILIASPLTFPHPVRWAIGFAVLSILCHLYAFVAKK